MRDSLKLVIGRRGLPWIVLGMVLAFGLSWVGLLFAFFFGQTRVGAERRISESVGRLAGAANVVIVSDREGMLRRCDQVVDLAGFAVRSAA